MDSVPTNNATIRLVDGGRPINKRPLGAQVGQTRSDTGSSLLAMIRYAALSALADSYPIFPLAALLRLGWRLGLGLGVWYGEGLWLAWEDRKRRRCPALLDASSTSQGAGLAVMDADGLRLGLACLPSCVLECGYLVR